ncbi:hypothetical protein [Nonomuraea zeae]|uniref:WXG100 family type VII secretion target n=1 Tax=Nonomuraea zeae TaxID=1642303 RepID=A0A5S4G2J6_9ACTN|nr:hypothetical protein [Nonomuraea zeae]TMR27072.1 hypothetical protein ETD85_40310 [Nonomuraea zeae]
MAPYDGDLEVFIGAQATATAAAFVMPYTYPIVGLMGLLIADPAEQHRAAEQWLDKNSVNIGPATTTNGSMFSQPQEFHPPMVAPARAENSSGLSDLAYLRSELSRLSREIGNSEDWAGRAYKSFLEKVDVLDGHLATLDSNREGCGNTLKCSAQGFHALMIFCVAVAGVLAALASYVLLARATAFGALAEGQAVSISTTLHTTMKQVFASHWKLVLKASVILGLAGVAYNQFAQDLPGLQAVSGSKPNLMEASAIYNPAEADIADSPESALDTSQLEGSSPLPEFGW